MAKLVNVDLAPSQKLAAVCRFLLSEMRDARWLDRAIIVFWDLVMAPSRVVLKAAALAEAFRTFGVLVFCLALCSLLLGCFIPVCEEVVAFVQALFYGSNALLPAIVSRAKTWWNKAASNQCIFAARPECSFLCCINSLLPWSVHFDIHYRASPTNILTSLLQSYTVITYGYRTRMLIQLFKHYLFYIFCIEFQPLCSQHFWWFN